MKRMLLLMALCMPLFGAAAQDETIEGVFDYDYSAEVFRLANVERRAWGKREFKEDDLLVEYGMVRAAEQIFSSGHFHPNGEYYEDQMYREIGRGEHKAANCIIYNTGWENAAWGNHGSPGDVMLGWLNSRGHCVPLMDTALVYLGVGMWSQSFGYGFKGIMQEFHRYRGKGKAVTKHGQEDVTVSISKTKGVNSKVLSRKVRKDKLRMYWDDQVSDEMAGAYDEKLAKEAVDMINSTRKVNSLKPLATDERLTQLARRRAAELTRMYNYFYRPDGSDYLTIADGGKKADDDMLLQIIASGCKSAKALSAALLGKHYSKLKIMCRDVNTIGVACYVCDGRDYWVMFMGGKAGSGDISVDEQTALYDLIDERDEAAEHSNIGTAAVSADVKRNPAPTLDIADNPTPRVLFRAATKNGQEVTFERKGSKAWVVSAEGCDGDLVLPDEVEYGGRKLPVVTIGDSAFAGCQGLRSVYIPAGVRRVGKALFAGCTSLEGITVAKGNEVYDSRKGCNAIIKSSNGMLVAGCCATVVPEGVTAVMDSAFYSTNIDELRLPPTVKRIGKGAFAMCEKLATVDLPPTVINIGEGAFEGCRSLRGITLPARLKQIGTRTFMRSGLKAITLPAAIAVIGDSAFAMCTGLDTIRVPAAVEMIGANAFLGVGFVDYDGRLEDAPWGAKEASLGVGIAEATSADTIVVGLFDYDAAVRIFDRVNDERAARGLPPLKLTRALLETSMIRAAEQTLRFEAKHMRPNGEKCFTQCEWEGQAGRMRENMHMGPLYDYGLEKMPGFIMDGWMGSEGHRNNILAEDVEYVGVGVFASLYNKNYGKAPDNVYSNQMFAERVMKDDPECRPTGQEVVAVRVSRRPGHRSVVVRRGQGMFDELRCSVGVPQEALRLGRQLIDNRAAAGLPPLDMVVNDMADELHLAEIAMGRVAPREGEYYLCVDEKMSTADAVLQRMEGLQQAIMDKRIVRLELIVLRANGKCHWLAVLNPKRERYISAPNKPSEEACTMLVSKVKGVPSLCKERQKLRL